MTPYESWQQKKYGNYIPEAEIDESYFDRTEDADYEVLSSDIHDEYNPINEPENFEQ